MAGVTPRGFHATCVQSTNALNGVTIAVRTLIGIETYEAQKSPLRNDIRLGVMRGDHAPGRDF